jgi:hypothetical protein
MVYYAYFHSIMNYGIIFWGNSSYNINIFRPQKKVIKILTNTINRNSCRQLFKILKIIPFQSQYICSLLCFVVNNILDQYQFISEVHNRNTRQGSNLYQPSAHLSLCQKGTYYMGTKLFNSLPPQLKHLYIDHKCFKLALKDFLYCHSFYTLEEYFDHGNN